MSLLKLGQTVKRATQEVRLLKRVDEGHMNVRRLGVGVTRLGLFVRFLSEVSNIGVLLVGRRVIGTEPKVMSVRRAESTVVFLQPFAFVALSAPCDLLVAKAAQKVLVHLSGDKGTHGGEAELQNELEEVVSYAGCRCLTVVLGEM